MVQRRYFAEYIYPFIVSQRNACKLFVKKKYWSTKNHIAWAHQERWLILSTAWNWLDYSTMNIFGSFNKLQCGIKPVIQACIRSLTHLHMSWKPSSYFLGSKLIWESCDLSVPVSSFTISWVSDSIHNVFTDNCASYCLYKLHTKIL